VTVLSRCETPSVVHLSAQWSLADQDNSFASVTVLSRCATTSVVHLSGAGASMVRIKPKEMLQGVFPQNNDGATIRTVWLDS